MTPAPFPEMPVPDMLDREGLAAIAARLRKALADAPDGGEFTVMVSGEPVQFLETRQQILGTRPLPESKPVTRRELVPMRENRASRRKAASRKGR